MTHDDTDMTPEQFLATRAQGRPVRIVASRAEYLAGIFGNGSDTVGAEVKVPTQVRVGGALVGFPEGLYGRCAAMARTVHSSTRSAETPAEGLSV